MQEFKLFRPSSGPAKELCGHFVPTVSNSPNAKRGTEFHEWIAKILRKEAKIEDVPEYLNQPLSWAVAKIPELFQEVEGIEQEVKIWGPPGPGDEEEKIYITEGTCDLWGWSKTLPRPCILDWKTGHERDYWAQLVIYGVGVLEPILQGSIPENKNDALIDMHLAFVDQERLFSRTFTYKELHERLQSIVQNARDPQSPYSVNEYCGYCDLRGECPAWDRERAMVTMGAEMDLQSRFTEIRSSPEKLGRFIGAFRRFSKIVRDEKLEEQALDYLRQGKDVPGVTRVRKMGNEMVQASLLDNLWCRLKPKERDSLMSADIKVARKLWAKYLEDWKFPETELGPTTYYIKTNGK